MRLAAFCLTLWALPGFGADFEGIITGKSVATGATAPGETSMKMYVAPAGFRMEATVQKPGGGTQLQMTILWQAAEPGVTYILNEASKAYMKHDISKVAKSDAAAPTVEKLGKTTYLGRSVEHVKLTFSDKRTSELWLDPSLHFPSGAYAAFGQGRSGGGAFQALEKAGVLGIPLKEQSGNFGWEATSVDKQAVPASMFVVPAGFHEAKDPLEMAPPGQQEALKQQRDALLKNMTPEQRAKYDQMMKQYQQ